MTLTYFWSMFLFHNPWKHKKLFLIFSGVTWFFIKSSYETSTIFICNMRSLLVFAISVMDVSIFILFWLEPDVSLLNLVSLAVAWHTKRYRSLMNSVKMIFERNGVIRKKCSRISWNLINFLLVTQYRGEASWGCYCLY